MARQRRVFLPRHPRASRHRPGLHPRMQCLHLNLMRAHRHLPAAPLAPLPHPLPDARKILAQPLSEGHHPNLLQLCLIQQRHHGQPLCPEPFLKHPHLQLPPLALQPQEQQAHQMQRRVQPTRLILPLPRHHPLPCCQRAAHRGPSGLRRRQRSPLRSSELFSGASYAGALPQPRPQNLLLCCFQPSQALPCLSGTDP